MPIQGNMGPIMRKPDPQRHLRDPVPQGDDKGAMILGSRMTRADLLDYIRTKRREAEEKRNYQPPPPPPTERQAAQTALEITANAGWRISKPWKRDGCRESCARRPKAESQVKLTRRAALRARMGPTVSSRRNCKSRSHAHGETPAHCAKLDYALLCFASHALLRSTLLRCALLSCALPAYASAIHKSTSQW
jgi:hypothetical protein